MRNLTVIYLAQNRRVDVTLANSGQQSVQLYPFNAHDAETLLARRPRPMPRSNRPAQAVITFNHRNRPAACSGISTPKMENSSI